VLEKQWSLESLGADGAHIDFVIAQLPYRIGRSTENDLVIANLGLSRVHAVLVGDISGQLRLIDEDSTNGTFVNRHRIEGYCLLKVNDSIHFGSAEFKLRLRMLDRHDATSFDDMHTMVMSRVMSLSENFLWNEAEFDELIMGKGLSGAAQPIVDASTRQVVGYELLGRADHPLLPSTPIELFGLAESMGRELDLSAAFRKFGFSEMAPRILGNPLFINVHPKETFDESLIASLELLRRTSQKINIVVEIHESAVTDIVKLRALANRLAQAGIRFAYDDFGAGQARFLELADVPPHFVKFDQALIHSLHKASQRKRRIVRDLVQIVRETDSVPLAEGVELEEEASACTDMGFSLIQGYLTGRPIPADSL
jgi:EAL domain-containing protein (putative c-di-GMP-specific phosphodiesterase class I)